MGALLPGESRVRYSPVASRGLLEGPIKVFKWPALHSSGPTHSQTYRGPIPVCKGPTLPSRATMQTSRGPFRYTRDQHRPPGGPTPVAVIFYIFSAFF